jgi:hypothetical protein
MGLPSETVSKPRLERKYAFLTAPSEKPAYSSCKSELMRRSSSACAADGVLAAGAVAIVVVGVGVVGVGAGATGAGVAGLGSGCTATGSGVIGLGSGGTGLGSAAGGVGVTGLGSGATGLGSGAGGATMGLGSGATTTTAGLGSGVVATGFGVMAGTVGLDSGAGVATTGLGCGAVGGFGVVVVGVTLGFGVVCAGLGVATVGLTVATTAGFGVGFGVATGAGAGLSAIGAVMRCWACVRRIGEPTLSAPEGLNIVVGRIVSPANGTAGFALRIATGTGRGRLGAPGKTGGNGWARGTTMVCAARGDCTTTVGVLRTGGALIVGVGAGAELTVTLLGGRCKLEPAVAARGKGANGLSARGAAAGRGLVLMVCALLVAVLVMTGFAVF